MVTTGWTGEEPGGAPAPMPVTDAVLAMQHHGSAVEIALAQAAADDAREERERAAAAVDPDEYAANLIARGYQPGQVFELSQRLADTEAELAGEEDKIEKGRRRAARMRDEHAAGRISVADIVAADIDEGDPGKAEKLRRRAASLRQQLADVAELAAPRARRSMDLVEHPASKEARELLAEAMIASSARSVRIAELVLEARRREDEAAAAARAQMAAERKGFKARFRAWSR